MTVLLVVSSTMKATTARRDADALCTNVVEAIADHTETDPLAMTPLGTVLDTDALDAVVESDAGVRVTFAYDEHTVLVCGDGTVSVDGDEYAFPAPAEGR